ncbi:MAG: hypothetical protein CMJ64_18980 [Planctomycetaceae bacterium]|nr:hypothetical protein [Planctomycetaceae bacterium]
MELLSTIELLLSEQGVDPVEERRSGDRRHYECTQLLAPFDQQHLPQQADFRQVHCRDLSPSGFSFYSYRRPDTDHVVVALGAIPFKFFVAEIVHANVVDGENGQEFFIGCRFVRRLGE